MCTIHQRRFVVSCPQWIGRSFIAFTFVATLVTAPAVACAQDDLSALVQRASEKFQPVSEQRLAGARGEVDYRMAALERFVGPSSANGQRWLRYLRWNELKEALAAEGPPRPGVLVTTYQRINRDENGLDRPQFRRLSDALRRYGQLLQISQQPDQAQYYQSQLERLKAQIDEYRREPSSATGSEIGSRIGFLGGLGEAPELVAAVRREFAQPNAFVDVSTSLIAAGAEPINRREPVTDCILGTSIRAQAHTVSSVGVSSIPSGDRAVLEFISDGRVRSQNVGNNGPAVIRSTSHTDFTARKRVELTDAAFSSRASHANARTNTNFQSISKRGGGLGSRLVSRIGWKRARQSERRAEAIAADHAEDRIERRFNNEMADELRDARRRYEDEFRRPLERRGEVPEHIRFSSDSDSLGIEVTQANPAQLAAAGPPPGAPQAQDMTMRLHESAVNNYSASLLGGATARQTAPNEDIKFDVKLPDWMKEAWESRKTEPTDGPAAIEEPFKEYSLRFRDGRPVTAKFVDGKVQLTVHIARLNSGEKSFTNWDVTGTYTPVLANGGVILRRDGDLVLLPTNFTGTLSSRQVAERRNLEEELNKRSAQGRGFPKSIEFEPLTPEGSLANAGPLDMHQCIADDGWLSLAWSRQQRVARQ